MLPYYGVFDNLAYRVDGGTVTLMGQVQAHAEERCRQRGEANRGSGAGGQSNPGASGFSDGRSASGWRCIAPFTALPGLDRYAIQAVPPIHIIVDNGKVTLEGVVSTQADKDLAGVRANSVNGVFSVANNLRVESEQELTYCFVPSQYPGRVCVLYGPTVTSRMWNPPSSCYWGCS